MAFDAFVYFDGKSSSGLEVKGESTDDVYKAKGAFEIHSFSLGASRALSPLLADEEESRSRAPGPGPSRSL
jgi:hypothetical protein